MKEKKKKFYISFPITGIAYLEVDADSRQEAFEKALASIQEKLDSDCRISEVFEEIEAVSIGEV